MFIALSEVTCLLSCSIDCQHRSGKITLHLACCLTSLWCPLPTTAAVLRVSGVRDAKAYSPVLNCALNFPETAPPHPLCIAINAECSQQPSLQLPYQCCPSACQRLCRGRTLEHVHVQLSVDVCASTLKPTCHTCFVDYTCQPVYSCDPWGVLTS